MHTSESSTEPATLVFSVERGDRRYADKGYATGLYSVAMAEAW